MGLFMQSKLAQGLKLQLEPVAVIFTDKKPEGVFQLRSGDDEGFLEGGRGCAGLLMVAAAKGKTMVFDEDTCGCPGGIAGLCLGSIYDKESFPTDCLLSTGDEALAKTGKTSPFPMGRGERFFATPELADHWMSQFPSVKVPQKYVVFRPFSQLQPNEEPTLVYMFANADQLSALVCMASFHRGGIPSVESPFGAACNSIVFAYHQIGKEYPKAILGYWDLFQRRVVSKDLLSFTVTYQMYQEMEGSVSNSCLNTDAWEKLASRQ